MTSRTGLPVGYRFHPTDVELVNHYLRLKMLGKDSQVSDIAEVDVCKWEPWELPNLSAIKSDDQEWFFFCVKHPNSNRTKRATESGYWKPTGQDRKVRVKGTVIATKKTLVFYKGRVPNSVRTNWVIHEYHSAATLPHQRPFVLCRLKKKTDEKTAVSTYDEGEASSYTASDFEIQLLDDSTPEVYIQPEANFSLFENFQPEDYDFSPPLQFPDYSSQGLSFLGATVTNSHNDERNRMPFQSDAEVEDEVFVNSLFVDEDEFSCEEIIHHNGSRAPKPLRKVYYADGGLSSDTDTDAAQTRYRYVVGPEEYGHREGGNGFLHNDSLRLDASHRNVAADTSHKICSITLARSESPQKVRTFTPQHQRRPRPFVARRAALGRSQSQRNSSREAVTQDKAKDASRHSSIVDLTQKEKSITDSDKVPKVAPVTNAKKSLKSTSGGSVGSDRKGYFTFQETSQPCHDSSPPLVYFVKLLFGIFLFLVVIREVLLYGNWC